MHIVVGQKPFTHERPRPARAFSLIELLVVISVIALLVSILLPALKSARDSAKSVLCKSKLQQIGVAYAVYANDFNDQVALSMLTQDGTPYSWAHRLAVTLGYVSHVTDFDLKDPEYPGPDGPFWCPSVGPDVPHTRWRDWITYARNRHFGVNNGFDVLPDNPPHYFHEFRTPSRTMLNVEFVSLFTAEIRRYPGSPYGPTGLLIPHGAEMVTNVLYVDGHAASMRVEDDPDTVLHPNPDIGVGPEFWSKR